MKLSTVVEWQNWINQVNPNTIDLNLSRINTIWRKFPHHALNMPTVVVGGTNGKGSTVKTIETIYLQAGYRVGVFTSPYLFRFNEYVRVNGVDLSDDVYCRLFSQIEEQRAGVQLTPFEYVTLAALAHFAEQHCDVCILEVGLGGRLDAVNVVDADVAIVTSIGLDHQSYLGDTRELISLEKVEIARKNKPLICGDAHPPTVFVQRAREIGAALFCIGTDFNLCLSEQKGEFRNRDWVLGDVPLAPLRDSNLACALQAVFLLQARLPVTDACIRHAFSEVRLPGRLQVFDHRPQLVVDVAHNVDSVKLLADWLKRHPCSGKSIAVFSMLADKDIHACLCAIQNEINEWCVAPLQSERAASRERLQFEFDETSMKPVFFNSIQEAFLVARKCAEPEDRIVVFGSFQTAAPILTLYQSHI